MSLNEESNNRAYVLGRLFATFEQAQLDSSKPHPKAKPTINTTIKNIYFNSACATPRYVFCQLVKLNHAHLAKMRKSEEFYGLCRHYQKLIGKLMDKLKVEDDPFPAQQSINDQLIFILGYYHQVQSPFTAKNKQQDSKEEA